MSNPISETLSVETKHAGPQPSLWRLVNIALGISALISLAATTGLTPTLTLSKWLFMPLFSLSSLQAVSPLSVVLARIGINLWLPAAILLTIFWLTGLHRKLDAPQSFLASPSLVISWAAYIFVSIIPLLLADLGDGAGALMFVIGVFLVPILLVLMVVTGLAATRELSALVMHKSNSHAYTPVKLILWIVFPATFSVMPLLLAPSNPLASTARETLEFASLCKDVGVRLMARPVAPVKSIAYDWDPKRMPRPPDWELIELDTKGSIRFIGGSAHSAQSSLKKLNFEFTESRPNRSGRATINPDAPYYHFPASSTNKPYYGVDVLSADVLGYFDADNQDEMKKAPIRQGAVRYRLTLTDRRSGAVLGEQSYVLDRVNGRACGLNVERGINQTAFIYDAINR
jgi:hypothetical protein